MSVRVTAAIAAAKLSRSVIRLLGRGATAFPGALAVKLCPDILTVLSKETHTILVTGTNGKTTTSRMVEQMLRDRGYSYFSNRGGANLEVGITTEFIANASLSGKPKETWAVMETDEAAIKRVGLFTDPEYIIVTNVFRDQLDRFGEVTATLGNILVGVQNSPNAVLCLNADDSLSASIAGEVDNQVLFYGVNGPIYKERVKEVSDAPYCIRCSHPYEYKYITYGHLGSYSCPNCGYERPIPDVAVADVAVTDEKHSVFTVEKEGLRYEIDLPVPGAYNIYNAVATMCLGAAIGEKAEDVAEVLCNFENAFGRMEQFDLDGVPARMILVKNPAGCSQVLNFLSNLQEESLFCILLNDHIGDGTDVSWIWDVDFENLAAHEEKLTAVYCGGIRAYDMALRLKYAGFSEDKVKVEQDYDALLSALTGQEKPVYIMPTYTAMMDFRGLISKKYGYKDFWE